MSDFVKPEVARLSLAGGQFVDVKKRLNHGESEDMFALMSPFVGADGRVQVNLREVRMAKVLSYVVGWSLSSDGTPVAMSLEMPHDARKDTINSLDPDRFNEIHQAIEQHENAVYQERAAEKKGRDGAKPSPVISPSPVVATGGMSGFVNSIATSTPSL